MRNDTALIHLGRRSSRGHQSINPPLVRTSTVAFETLADYKKSHHQTVFESPRYGRSGTSTTFELQETMAALEGVSSCIATASGLAAITAVLAAHAGPGRHLLLSDGVYGPTRTYCEKELALLGTEIEFFPHGADITERLKPNTQLVFIETPSSLTMQMLDVRAICGAAHARGIPVAADATWGTPLFFKPHALGLDISIHSATKFINGHSDVMLGLITGTHNALAAVRAHCDRVGSHAAPDACWLALRGLRTLAVRLRRHECTAMAIAFWLQQQPQVERVLFPALPSDPGHALWRSQFSGAAGPLTFELVPCDELAFERFINAFELFSLGTSWGGFESLVLPAVPYALRGLAVLPNEGRLVRLHLGLEDAEDLRADLLQALAQISAAA